MNEQAYTGCLLGTAVGDALGLPYEGISPRRAARLFPDRTRHHFLLGRGMVSDDTEHACFVSLSLIKSQGNEGDLQRYLARYLRWWVVGIPAGVGLATLKSILRLWIGLTPRRSGVFSAGNGPAMRSPILGIVYGSSKETLREYVQRATERSLILILRRSMVLWQSRLPHTRVRLYPQCRGHTSRGYWMSGSVTTGLVNSLI